MPTCLSKNINVLINTYVVFQREGKGKYVGEYKDNKRWNGTEYDKKGNILGKYVEGRWIKQ